MKIKIEAVIEIPDEVLIPEQPIASAVQVIFDSVTNYVVCAHFRDALDWAAKGKPEGSTEDKIYKHHNYWGDLLSGIDWSYTEVP